MKPIFPRSALFAFATLTALGCSSTTPLSQTEAMHADHSSMPAVHGMVLFGTGEHLYISHIPMFHAPHDWQAVWSVSLDAATGNPKQTYLDQVLANGVQKYSSLEPKPFVLTDFLAGKFRSFTASLHLGSFEQNGPTLVDNIAVTATSLVTSHQLDPHATPATVLTYLFTPDTGYLFHKITAPDNFDHIVQLTWHGEIDKALLADANAEITFPNTQDLIANRLKEDMYFEVSGATGHWVGTHLDKPQEGAMILSVKSSFYCTPGPDFFGDCL